MGNRGLYNISDEKIAKYKAQIEYMENHEAGMREDMFLRMIPRGAAISKYYRIMPNVYEKLKDDEDVILVKMNSAMGEVYFYACRAEEKPEVVERVLLSLI